MLTETHAWAYYRVPTVSYEFTTPAERETLATSITVALAAIRMADAEVHLRIAQRPYAAADWATRLDATSDGGPGWIDYLEEMYRHVWAKDFWTKEVYLGVRLGQRGMRAQLSGGFLSQFTSSYRAAEQLLGLSDESVPAAEIARWTEHAERLGRALGSSALAATHASSDEVAWLFRHVLAGTAGEPQPSAAKRRTWGAGEIESLLEGQVHNGRTVLRLEHPAGESWAAFLSFARFPDVMYFPEGEPWLHYADALPFPVEASLRMKLIAPARASKDVSRRLAHARDMDAHIREAGAELPIALMEQIEAARLLEHGITKERLPFVYGWHRLMVTAPDRDVCVRRAEALIEHYRDAGIDVMQLHRRPVLAAVRVAAGRPGAAELLPAAAAAVHGRGRDADGDGRSRRPGHARRRLDRPVHRRDARPGPVGGALRPARRRREEPADRRRHHRRARRRQDDARAAADLAARAAGHDRRGHRPQGRRRVPGWLAVAAGRQARVVPLGSAAPGLLDPFSFGDDLAERRTMATETLRLLLPRMSEDRESAMVQAVGAVASGEQPSLGKVVAHLEQSADPASSNLGAVLRSMSEMRLARLCFAPSGGQRIDAAGWTTVFTLAGLTLPDTAREAG